MSLVYYLPLRKRGWPSPARRWIANPLVSDLGSSNLPPRVNIYDFLIKIIFNNQVTLLNIALVHSFVQVVDIYRGLAE
jgi:hypothetical protein